MKTVKPLSLLASIVALSFVLTSCSASKVAQCNELVAVANETATFGQEFGANPPKPEEGGKGFTNAADKLDQLTAKLEAVKLEDEKLKGYRASFASMYKNLSQGLRDSAVALEKKDMAAMQAALQSIQESAEPESKLVDEVNGYCKGS